MKMKNILVTTDFSNDAYCALFYISKLLASKECTFFILNVYDELTPLESKKNNLFGGKKLLKQIEQESNEKLTQVFHKIVLDTDNPNHEYHTFSRKGALSKVVAKIVKENVVDLVVMGNKGKTGAKEIFMGSNTFQVANEISLCPLLAVPKQLDYKVPNDIAFITDYKKGCAKETLEPLLHIAALHNSTISVMHINEEETLDAEQELKRKLLENCLKDFKYSFHNTQNSANKTLVIDSFLARKNIDMFSMVQQKHSFLEKFMREPVIKDLSLYADIPLLILPNRH
tara:strand:- start:7728 stop:8582 length:855 start_codon:yes stop_codon:yes gene_type:complete